MIDFTDLQRLFGGRIKSPIPQGDMVNNDLGRAAAEARSKYGAAFAQIDQANRDNGQNPIQQALGKIIHPSIAPAYSQSSGDDNTQIPTGIDAAMKFIQSQTPDGQDPMKYYKAFQDPSFMQKIQQADMLKPGLANILLLQGFFESTLGNKTSNLFGTLPGGEGSGKSKKFATPSEAIDYQLGDRVLGGGANPGNMDIIHDKSPLTKGRLKKLYESYNPSGDYINPMIEALVKK